MKFLLTNLIFVFLLACCSEVEQVADPDTSEYFKHHLQADMSYKAIRRTFGEPDRDIGSGIHIYVYMLDDSTEIRIGYTDKILYAVHVDSSNQLLEILI